MAEDKSPLAIDVHVFILQIKLWCLVKSGLCYLFDYKDLLTRINCETLFASSTIAGTS